MIVGQGMTVRGLAAQEWVAVRSRVVEGEACPTV